MFVLSSRNQNQAFYLIVGVFVVFAPVFALGARAQDGLVDPGETFSSSVTTTQVLFDFPGASELHRFFNYQDQGDSAKQKEVLREWSLKIEQLETRERATQKTLIRLLQQDEQKFENEVESVIKSPSPSWGLLLALHQIESRRPAKSKDRQSAIQDRIQELCNRILQGYLKGLISQKELSSYIAQTYARLDNNRNSIEWLESVLAAMRNSEAVDLFPILSLYSDRLVELTAQEKDPDSYRVKVLNINLKLNDLLTADEKCRELHPLAVAKCRYLIASLQKDETLRLSWLAAALEAIDAASFTEKAVSTVWVFESRQVLGDVESGDNISVARRLFDYRLEMLRTMILLDGYRIGSKRATTNSLSVEANSTPASVAPFSIGRLVNSLETLVKIQNENLVDPYVKLMTLRTLASVKFDKDKAASELLMDEAMALAWKMRTSRSEELQVKSLILETLVAWIEIKLARGKPAELASQVGLPEIHEALSYLREEVKTRKVSANIAERIRRISMLEVLAGSDPALEENLKEFVTNEAQDDRDLLLFRSLDALLDARKGKVDPASLSAESDAIQSSSSLCEQLLPLYILAEAEIETEFVTLKSMTRLHAILRDKRIAEQTAEGELQKLRLENALQLSAAASHLHRLKLLNAEHPVSQALKDVLTDNTIAGDESDYRRVLMHLVDEKNEGISETLRNRAQAILAADSLSRIKQRLLETRETKRIELVNAYNDSNEVKKEEGELKDLFDKVNEIAEGAKELKAPEAREKAKKDYYEAREEYQFRMSQFESKRLRQFDEIFRVPDQDLGDDQDSNTLRDVILKIQSLLRNGKLSAGKSNLSYNLRCILIESLLLLGEDNWSESVGDDRVTLEEVDQYANSLTVDALAFRQKVRAFETDSSDNTRALMQLRNRVFDRYQLGFELAVRWFVMRKRIEKAIEVAAITTNRSYVELGNQGAEAIENSFVLPKHFVAYFCGNESLLVFWRLAEGAEIKYAESAVDRLTLEENIELLRKNYSDPNGRADTNLDRRLSVWLLPKQLCDDLAENLASSPESCIYIAPHGPLFKIPLEGLSLTFRSGLSDPQLGLKVNSFSDVTLGEVKPLIYLPTLLATGKPIAADSVSRKYLLIQCTSDVGQEVVGMRKAFQTLNKEAVEVLDSPDLKKSDLLRRLKDADGWDVIHIGAHGVKPGQGNVPSTGDDASFYLTSERISTADLFRLFEGSQLRANHVFLSACESQVTLDDDLNTGGNTLKALGTTFLAIGASDVVASHWEVATESTKETFERLAEKIVSFQRDHRTNPGDYRDTSTEELARLLFAVRAELSTIKEEWRRPYYRYAFTVWAQRYSP